MPVESLRKAALQVERAQMAFNTGLNEYQNACQRQDWEIIDAKRLQAVCALESFLDNVAMSHRLMGNRFNG